MTEHFFGGDWTETKLHILKYYIGIYTKALQGKFTLHYFDACAGTGTRNKKQEAMPLIGVREEIRKVDGSARIALQLDQPFDKYFFVELNRKRYSALQKLKSDFPNRNIEAKRGDANKLIQEEMSSPIWKKGGHRGVIFLDPYGMEIDWETVKAISSTKCLDVWFLISISGINRNTSSNLNKLEGYKVRRLNKFFGTDKWQSAFYQKVKVPSLFDSEREIQQKRANIEHMEEWAKKHLESIFPYVGAPVKLPKAGAQLFSLFFCLSNDSTPAINLAKKISNYALKHDLPL